MDSLCLGPVEIGPPDQCIDLDARQVTVRRENSDGKKVSLMKEMTNYVGTIYPNYARDSLFYPNTGLQIDPEILQSTEGFPEAGLTRADVPREWSTAVHGYQRAAKLLESVLSDRPSLIVNGLHQENLLKIAIENNMLAGNDIAGNLTNRHKIIGIDDYSKTSIEVICSASKIYEESSLKEEILQMNLELQNGRNLFTKVFAPAAKLSESWTWLGLLCLPQVENRSVLIDRHGLSPSMVQFILTKQELCGDANSLRAELRLKNREAAKDEYGRAVVLCVGLERISFDTQVFAYQKDIQETLTRIVGAREEGEVMGLGGGGGGGAAAQLAGSETIPFSQLSGKPLGSLPNIIFWNDRQMKILESMRELGFTVMFGDFGGGKTSVLVACALELANKYSVFFVSGLDTLTKEEESIMDIALETKWKNSSVQVVTVSRMRRELGKGMDVTVPELIHDFIEVHCNPTGKAVFIIDELPVSRDDLEKMKTREETQLKQLLVKLQEKSKVAWVALSTSSMLESHRDDIILPGNIKMSGKAVDRVVQNTVLCIFFLPILIITTLTGHTGIISLCTVAALAALSIIILCVMVYKQSHAGFTISPTTLPSYLSTLPAYTQVHLQRNMRSSGMIAASADPGDVGKYSTRAGKRSVMTSAIPKLLHSTIAGTIRPHIVMAPWGLFGNIQPDYPAIARCIHHSLSTIFHLPTPVTRQHVAILVGQSISPRLVATCLNQPPMHTTLYSAGINQYNRYGGTPVYEQTSATSTQRDKVTKWLTGPGGILITHSHLYMGMEVGYAVYVTGDLGYDRDTRSNILRAVGALCVVTNSSRVNKDDVRKNFSVVECTTTCACVNHDKHI